MSTITGTVGNRGGINKRKAMMIFQDCYKFSPEGYDPRNIKLTGDGKTVAPISAEAILEMKWKYGTEITVIITKEFDNVDSLLKQLKKTIELSK